MKAHALTKVDSLWHGCVPDWAKIAAKILLFVAFLLVVPWLMRNVQATG
jgi:hypothetical protein